MRKKKLKDLQYVEFDKTVTNNEVIFYNGFFEVKLPVEPEQKDAILNAKIVLIDGYLMSIVVEKK